MKLFLLTFEGQFNIFKPYLLQIFAVRVEVKESFLSHTHYNLVDFVH